MKKFADYGTCSLYFYGAPHVDFLDCEWLLLPAVTLHLGLYRSPNLCALETLTDLDADEVKSLDKNPPIVVIEKASLFVDKIVLSDTVKLSIERALTKGCAVYPYLENSTKSYIIQSGQNCFVKENIFGTEPIRRSTMWTMWMVRNRFFPGTTTASTPFRYEKFDLQKVKLLRGNGLPVAGTPLDTSNDTRLFYSTITALGFERGGNGNTLEDYLFYLVFLPNVNERSQQNLTLFPELTGAGITLELSFSKALPEAVELFLIGERFSQIFIDNSRNISKNSPLVNG